MASQNLQTPLRLNSIITNIERNEGAALLLKQHLLHIMCKAMILHFSLLIRKPDMDRYEQNDIVRTDFVTNIRQSEHSLLNDITDEGLLLLRQHIDDMEGGPFNATQSPPQSPQHSVLYESDGSEQCRSHHSSFPASAMSNTSHRKRPSHTASVTSQRDTSQQRILKSKPIKQASSIPIPKFSGKSQDWKLFKTSLLAYFMAHGLDQNLLNESVHPIDPIENGEFWIILVTSLQGSDVANHCIEFQQDGKGLFTHLLLKFEKRGIVHIHHLFRRFTNATLNPNDDPSNFIRNMKNVRDELSHVGQCFTDQVFIGELIYALPDNYDSVKTRLLENETNDIDTYTRLVIGHHNILSDKSKFKMAPSKPTLVRQPPSQSEHPPSQTKSKFQSSSNREPKSQRPYCTYHHLHGHSTEECREKPKPSANLTCTDPSQKPCPYTALATAQLSSRNDNTIILDSGATSHFVDPSTAFAKKFLRIEHLSKGSCEVNVAGGSKHKSTGLCNFFFKTLDNSGRTHEIKLTEALVVPNFGTNLLSMARFCNNGIHVNTEQLLLCKAPFQIPLIWEGNLLKMTAMNKNQTSAHAVSNSSVDVST